MNDKKLIVKTMVVAGLVLPAIGLGVGMANASPPVPWVPGCQAITRPGGCQAPGGTAPTVPATIGAPAPKTSGAVVANGNKVLPTSTASPFGSLNTVAPAPTVSAATVANGSKVLPTTTATGDDGGVVPGRHNPSSQTSGSPLITLFGGLPGLRGLRGLPGLG